MVSLASGSAAKCPGHSEAVAVVRWHAGPESYSQGPGQGAGVTGLSRAELLPPGSLGLPWALTFSALYFWGCWSFGGLCSAVNF